MKNSIYMDLYVYKHCKMAILGFIAIMFDVWQDYILSLENDKQNTTFHYFNANIDILEELNEPYGI